MIEYALYCLAVCNFYYELSVVSYLGLEFAQWSNEIIVKLWFIRMNISGSFFETFIWD